MIKTILAVVLLLATTLAANAQSRKNKGAQPSAAAINTENASDNAQPGNADISPDAIAKRGFFDVTVSDDKYFFSIPDSLLGRDILIVNRVVKATTNSGLYAGDEIGLPGQQKIIRFQKAGNGKINLLTVSYNVFPKDSSSPMYRAVSNSNLLPIAASFDIKAPAANGTASLIDATELVKGGGIVAGTGAKEITGLKAFGTNIEISAIRNVPYTPTPGQEQASLPAQGSGGGEMEMNSSLLLLPKTPMQPRYADDRIGYSTTGYTDFEANRINKINMIRRWRLEPKPADLEKYKAGGLVEPQKPIVFYIDPATPAVWVPYLMQAVNDWQPAFEQAGFKNAIVAKLAPTPQQDSTWCLEDAAHSAIVYKASANENVAGTHIFDPRSGEIVESHINWYHNVIKMLHDKYLIAASPNDPTARKMLFDDTLTGRLIRAAACHEVGHAIGLEHNMGASATVPVEKLRDKAWVEANGISPSIMEYTLYNYVAQPEDGIGTSGLVNRLGDYDKWAVEWGYRLLPQYKNPAEEKAWLSPWATEKLQNPSLWWGSEGSPDPRCQAEDLGNDAVKASEYGIKNLQRLVAALPQYTRVANEDYASLADMYHKIIDFNQSLGNGMPTGQFSRYMLHVLASIGGRYSRPALAENNTPVYAPVPKASQQQAVDFLNRHLFATPGWLFDTAILTRTGDDPLNLLGRLQGMVVETLFLQCANNLVRNSALWGSNTYQLDDLLADLKKGIWAELPTHQPIDIYRRNLQKKYLNTLCPVLNTSGSTELSAAVRAHLQLLQKEIVAALPHTTHAASRLHLQEAQYVISKALK